MSLVSEFVVFFVSRLGQDYWEYGGNSAGGGVGVVNDGEGASLATLLMREIEK